MLVCLALTTLPLGFGNRGTVRAVVSFLTATELAQQGKVEESRAQHLGRERLGRQGNAKVEKQVESRKHTRSPELKTREFSEVHGGME